MSGIGASALHIVRAVGGRCFRDPGRRSFAVVIGRITRVRRKPVQHLPVVPGITGKR